MDVHVLQHVASEGPGLIRTLAEERGHVVHVLRLDEGAPVPDVAEVEALVVLGGPMGALDDDALPTLAAERALLAAAVERQLPVLGVCLGAQMLAAALGGAVERGPQPEVGLGYAQLTSEGKADPVLGPAAFRLAVLHWHADTYSLPPGAVRLASSDLYREQAFRAGPRAYGLQFHVEVDADLAAAIADDLPGGVELDPRRLADVESEGRAVLSRWLGLAEAPHP